MYLPKVKPHGLIAGDDYATPGWWQDGVTKAVDEAIAGGRFEKLHIENNQFLLRKVQVGVLLAISSGLPLARRGGSRLGPDHSL